MRYMWRGGGGGGGGGRLLYWIVHCSVDRQHSTPGEHHMRGATEPVHPAIIAVDGITASFPGCAHFYVAWE